jgi:Ca2+-binding RTX toxin-like protein
MASIGYDDGNGNPITFDVPSDRTPGELRADIQNILDIVGAYAPNVARQTITLSADTFEISGAGPGDGALLIPSNVTLKGASETTTIIKLAAGSSNVEGVLRTASGATQVDGKIKTTSNVTIQDLTIDGAGMPSTTKDPGNVYGFYCGPRPGTAAVDDNIKLENVSVKNCSGYGFDPHEQTTNLSMINCNAENNFDGFTIDFCSGILENCTATGNARHGFNIVTGSHDLTLKNCSASGNGTISSSDGSGLVVQTGNNEARSLTSNILVSGGSYTENEDAGITIRQASNVTIAPSLLSGTTVTGNDKQGIKIEGSSGVTITGSTINSNGLPATSGEAEIRVAGYLQSFNDGSAGIPASLNDLYLKSKDISITNNFIGLSGATQTATYGIYYDSDTTFLATTGNTNYFVSPNDFKSVAAVPGTAYDYVITAGNDNIVGTTGNDIIAADSGDDDVSGGDGNDVLYGNDGNDILKGEDGNDTLRGFFDNDTLNGGNGIDTADFQDGGKAVSADLVTGTATGLGHGDDTLIGIENLTGGGGSDSLTGDSGGNVLDGRNGSDHLIGNDGDDVLIGGSGLDTLTGGAGFDFGAFEATSQIAFTLDPTGATQAVGVTGSVDTISGIEAVSISCVGTNNDALTGGAFNDTFEGGGGDDTLNGLGGIDTASYSLATVGVTVNLSLAGAQNTVGAGMDTLSGFESVIGSRFNDILTGGSGDDTLEGGDDKKDNVGDALNGGAGTDTASYARATKGVTVNLSVATLQDTGGAGKDTITNIESLVGSNFSDNLIGNGFANTLDGGAGADTMAGGLGNDIHIIDNTGDAVTELAGQGTDSVRTTLAVYTIAANVERLYNDALTAYTAIGNASNNTMYGNNGDDRFRDYNLGTDAFSGGNGVDSMYYSGTTAAILNFATGIHGGSAAGDAFASVEKFFGSSAGHDQMTAGAARATFNGQDGNDTLTGGDNHDKLYGEGGTDILSGGGGNDQLYGGAGTDTLTGGDLRDDFFYTETVASGGWGTDTITDFQDGLDFLRFASPVADAFGDFAITGNGTTSVTLSLIAAPANTITLNGAAPITLSAADFLFF